MPRKKKSKLKGSNITIRNLRGQIVKPPRFKRAFDKKENSRDVNDLDIVEIEPSERASSKYQAVLKNRNTGQLFLVHFGNVTTNHFRDTTDLRLYSHLDHNDQARRLAYHQRYGKKAKRFSPLWFSLKYLWN